MQLRIDAVYENGVLRPLQPLDLGEHERVIVSIVKGALDPGRSQLDVQYIDRVREELRSLEEPTDLGDVRNRLSKIEGSMATEIVAERGER